MSTRTLAGVLGHIRRLADVERAREQTDRVLLERFVSNRDEPAFAVLVARHGPMVLGVCRRVLGNVADAEDAFQATFLVLARKAASVRRAEVLCGWLHRVAHAVAHNARRERARRKRHESGARPIPCEDPAGGLEWREVRAALDEEIARLPARYRAPLILCYLDGRTRDQAAETLGLAAGALHGRLERGRRLLRDRLARRGLALSAALATLAAEQAHAVSPTVVMALSRAALQCARGEMSVVSAHVLTLTRHALLTMRVAKVKLGLAALVCAGLLAAAGASGLSGFAQDKNSPPRPAPSATNKPVRAPDPASVLKELQGTWQGVEAEADGAKSQAEDVTNLIMTFKEQEVTIKGNDGRGGERRLKLTLHPASSPPSMDLVPLDGPDQGKTTGAIFALEKGRLKFCSLRNGGARPKDFTTRKGDGKIVIVLKRIDPNKPRAQSAADDPARQVAAVLRDWERVEHDFWGAFSKAKTTAARQKVDAERRAKAAALAERCMKLAAAHPDHAAALTALFWVAGNSPDPKLTRQALTALKEGQIARADLGELFKAVNLTRATAQELAPVVLLRVKKNLEHRRAAHLLTWVCAQYHRSETAEVPPAFAEAGRLIMRHFADSPDIANFCECLAPLSVPLPWACRYEADLRSILAKNHHRLVRVTGQFALASIVASEGPARQDEAVKLFERFLKDFDGSDPQIAGVERELLHQARNALDEPRGYHPAALDRQSAGGGAESRRR